MALSARALAQTPAERVAPLKVLSGATADTLLVHEFFTSLQGEGTRAGRVCTFVRLTGCHLRCHYCDTEHAFFTGERRAVVDVVDDLKQQNVSLVQITGGEPLLQSAVLPLLRTLCDEGFEVLLETSGAVSTEHVDPRVITILDIKTPSSGEADRNAASNWNRLQAHDEVKFVIGSEEDYAFAVERIAEEDFSTRCAAVLLSPVEGAQEDGTHFDKALLASWMIRDRLPARMQVQMHRVLWGDQTGV